MPVSFHEEEHLEVLGPLKPPRYVMPTDEPYRLFPVDVARISGLTIPTIRKWSDAGLIPHIRLPNGWRKYRMSDAYKLGGHKLPPAYPYQEDKP